MSTLMGQLQSRIEAAVNKTGTYNEALQNLADAFGVPPSETGSRLIPVVKVFDPTIDNATAAQNYLLYNSSIVSGGLPAMAMDFTSGTLDSRVTFTRASTATRVNASGLIESVAIDGPRFDYDPVSRAPKGLLIEEQRTNLLTYSEDFSNAAWSKSNITVTANSDVAPDGSQTADTLLGTAPGSANSCLQSITAAASVYTFSVWVKAKTATTCGILLRDETAATNLSVTAQIQSGPGSVSGTTVVSVSGLSTTQWTRVALTLNAPVTAGNTLRSILYPETATSANTTGKSNVFWGAQLEAGSFATSYIPTVAAQVTRSADNASMTGTNFSSWYNQSAGTIFAEADVVGVGSSGAANQTSLSISAAATYNDSYVLFIRQSINNRAVLTNLVGITKWYAYVSPVAANTFYKHAFSYESASMNFADSGSIISPNLTDTSLITATRLTLGAYSAGTAFLNGHIRRIMYYNTRLTNAQLQALTS